MGRTVDVESSFILWGSIAILMKRSRLSKACNDGGVRNSENDEYPIISIEFRIGSGALMIICSSCFVR